MKKYIIKLNNKVYEVEMEEVTSTESSALASEISTSSASNTAKASSSSSTVGQSIEAPMPGNILNITVKEGDRVKKGDILLILEAMKMENEIVSPIDGVISFIGVNQGQVVNAGEVLIKIS